MKKEHDPVNHPSHYTSHPSGVECIQITEHMNFNLGNVFKYLWRSGIKNETAQLEDIKKAQWYLNREIKRVEKIETDEQYDYQMQQFDARLNTDQYDNCLRSSDDDPFS